MTGSNQSERSNDRTQSIAGVDKGEIYDLIPGMVVVMDTGHTILDLNAAAATTAGKTKAECIGAKFWDLYDNSACRAGTCPASEAARTAKVCEGEAFPLIQGKEVPVLVTAAPRLDASGKVIGIVELVFPAAGEVGLARETERLATAVAEGRLGERINEGSFRGRHLERARVINRMVEAVARPLAEVSQVMQRMAVNDHTLLVEGSFQGSFAELAQATNAASVHVKNTVKILGNVAVGDYTKDLEDLKRVRKCSENDTLVRPLSAAWRRLMRWRRPPRYCQVSA